MMHNNMMACVEFIKQQGAELNTDILSAYINSLFAPNVENVKNVENEKKG
jgi:hypothetical protein